MNYGDRPYPGALTVTELNTFIKGLLDTEPTLTGVYVKGEISNFKAHTSGHFYFTLKDEGSSLRCVMFRSSAVKMSFMPENGMRVTAYGRISAFVRDGQYQLYADSMEPDGTGSLYIAYEQLKAALEAEGLFSVARKKPIPKIPSTVGIVTSPTGAAVRDMINVMGRRFPFAKLVIYPSKVQGADAPEQLCRGIEYFNAAGEADVIIIGRGGGSLEDLWAFNSEALARVVAASKVPVISAVGHETDFTICDFVADRRAPTPSAAAEIAVPDTEELKVRFNNIVSREAAVLKRIIENYSARLDRCVRSRALSSPAYSIEDKSMALLSLVRRAESVMEKALRSKEAELAGAAGRLNALNPLAVMSRGYSAVFTREGSAVGSVDMLRTGERVKLLFADGSAEAEITDIRNHIGDGYGNGK